MTGCRVNNVTVINGVITVAVKEGKWSKLILTILRVRIPSFPPINPPVTKQVNNTLYSFGTIFVVTIDARGIPNVLVVVTEPGPGDTMPFVPLLLITVNRTDSPTNGQPHY